MKYLHDGRDLGEAEGEGSPARTPFYLQRAPQKSSPARTPFLSSAHSSHLGFLGCSCFLRLLLVLGGFRVWGF